MTRDATKRTPRLDDRVLDMLDYVYETPIGWIQTAGEYEQWLPLQPHGQHKYDGGCAVCRCGDDSRALEAFLTALLPVVSLEAQKGRK